MAKININKPTGSVEVLNLLTAFKCDDNTYVILDTEKVGSMGLPIIYVSKYTEKLEKINDADEWQNVKNYLKGIINGTNFLYVKLNEQINADEVYYTPLTLPQASFELIKSRYVVADTNTTNDTSKVLTPESTSSSSKNDEVVVTPISNAEPAVNVTPIIPNNDVASNITSAPVTSDVSSVNVEVEPVKEVSTSTLSAVSDSSKNKVKIDNTNLFETDKGTFLKACENMFDALVSKYQKQLSELERREQECLMKEQEINLKLKNANEHLANAEAREQVANIAHDNAQRVMDISNFMPNNPNNIQN